MKRWTLLAATALSLLIAVLAGCSTLDERQRAWIFQPSDRSWSGGLAAAEGMDDVWIGFQAKASGEPATLHGLWLPSDRPGGPILLYLHGARFNVTGSAPRMRRMQELGFSVLGVDYRGFGKSTAALPSEESAYEDARAAWDWLARKYPDRPRYVFGHSLGGPIAINLATEVSDESGTIVEGTFTSIADVVSTSKWGWMPVSLLITQRFEAARKVGKIGSPLLVVHGGEDRLIAPDLGRKLFEAAAQPKLFMLVEGGSHHNTNSVGQAQYRQALAQLFSLK
ncbi:MAG: alpha/beta fold hydrolase [Polaromonas sp.]|uniref:alpha/beta hydrolase n=1 Tax=Polaromonas sp. TaxID=1869339 RepID=UPI002489DFFD|nr:alpha/beta fold hydrolase [Polaromonas sp.]MDI1238736.1 alpha/beta fold hydrolase [Polaromonas sp.]